MHDPIEGRFRVVGEAPPKEPAVKSWGGLLTFAGLFVAAVLFKVAATEEPAPPLVAPHGTPVIVPAD